MTTTLQSCPQCRQICIQQQNLLVLYGAPTTTSGAELGDLLETYTNTEKKRIAENGGQPVVRAAHLSDEVRRQCVDGHKTYRQDVLRTVEDVTVPLMPFTDLLDFVEPVDQTLILRIRQYQEQERSRLQALMRNIQ
jgi:sulfur carrier protein ThiS